MLELCEIREVEYTGALTLLVLPWLSAVDGINLWKIAHNQAYKAHLALELFPFIIIN